VALNLERSIVPTEPDYTGLAAAQRQYFLAGDTRSLAWRVSQLKAMKAMFLENRPALYDALYHCPTLMSSELAVRPKRSPGPRPR
jgi:hypothetical protein